MSMILLGNDVYVIKKFIAFLCLAIVSTSCAREQLDFRNLTNEEIHKEFTLASKIDGKPGTTEYELKMKFGASDLVSKSEWRGGKQLIYKLSDNRRMKVDILNGLVMLAIIENTGDFNYLLDK